MSSENRTFSRVPTRLKMFFRFTEKDARPLFLDCLGCDFKDISLENLNSPYLPKELLEFLSNLNNKLDVILSLLNQNSLSQDFPYKGEVVEISGAGLKFLSQEKLEPGTPIEVALSLSTLPPLLIGLVGEILRLEGEQNQKYLYALKYLFLRDSDREQIVQFVFKEQRELLRGKKL